MKKATRVFIVMVGIIFGLPLISLIDYAYAAVFKAEPSWFEHVDLMQALIGGLFFIVAWFICRTLRTIDANQTEIFKKLTNHENRLSHLEGAHETRTGMKLSCAGEP